MNFQRNTEHNNFGSSSYLTRLARGIFHSVLFFLSCVYAHSLAIQLMYAIDSVFMLTLLFLIFRKKLRQIEMNF